MPFAAFPVTLTFGLLIGVAWLVIMAIATHTWGYGNIAVVPFIVGAIVAMPLQQKIFANRSVYALVGLGLGMYAAMVVSAYAIAGLHTFWSDDAWLPEQFFRHRIAEGVLLVLGLYAGDEVARRLGGWGRRTFYVHR